MYFVYMLRCEDNSLYTGITNDFEKRYEKHTGRLASAAKYTKSRRVVGVAALWTAPCKSDALKLEYRIKKLTKKKKEYLVLHPEEVNNLLPGTEYVYIREVLK